jgi:hypothetical protein
MLVDMFSFICILGQDVGGELYEPNQEHFIFIKISISLIPFTREITSRLLIGCCHSPRILFPPFYFSQSRSKVKRVNKEKHFHFDISS